MVYNTLPEEPHDCKCQPSKRYILADSRTDRMSQWANVVEQFAPITFRRFLPNAPLQSDVTGSVHTPPLSAPVASANLPDARISCFRHRSGCYFLFSVMWLVATARLQSEKTGNNIHFDVE